MMSNPADELLAALRRYMATKEDADNDYNINHDRKNERRVWNAFDALKKAFDAFEVDAADSEREREGE
jgi:hypothetical protein